MSSLFLGSGVALVTPFLPSGEIDYVVLSQLIEWHILNKTDALILAGTTGEAATLSLEEKRSLFSYSVKVANKRIHICAGTGTNNTAASIELSLIAQEAGVDSLLLVTPFYNKPTQRGMYAHFEAIASRVQIPIILYNVPSRTSVNLLPETVEALSKITNIRAIKEASADISQIAKVFELCGDDFIVYSGNDDQTFAIMALGGKGVISVTANIAPLAVSNQVHLFLNGMIQEAKQLGNVLRPLHDIMFIETNPVPVKQALQLLGTEVGGVRLPLVSLEEKNFVKLQTVINDYQQRGIL
jgi:4-hydroxy-tetrahydrodipicolinate synthase